MSGIDDEPTLPDGGSPLFDDADLPRVLGGRYVLEERLGRGGGATVWRAYDRGLARSVAVKVLRPGTADTAAAAARLRREAATAGRAAHPGIVAVYDTGVDGDVAWLALEHVDGPTLLEVLRRHPTGLPPQAAAAVAEQTAVALAHAHARGLVHRDVKPANLLLGEGGVVKLADFGVAATRDGDHAPELAGSRRYAAPEQLVGGDGDDEPPVDVHALGVVLHECLTGRPAEGHGRDGEMLSPRQVRPDVPRDLDEVVRRATRPVPAERYPDGAAMATALRPLVASDPFELTARLLADDDPRDVEDGGVEDGAAAPGDGADWRWVALGIIALVAAGLLSALAVTGRGDPGDGPSPVADAGVPVTRVEVFDPYGSVGPEDTVPTASVDGVATTVWRTPAYPVPLRSLGTPGLGLWIDVGEPRAIEAVEVDLATGGITLELLHAATAPSASTTEADWSPLGRLVRPGPSATFAAQGTSARYWLVWITELEPVGEAWQAGIQDIRFRPVGTS